MREFSKEFAPGDTPYYPIPNVQAAEQYKKYKALADTLSHVTFVGRLATYKYYNMDQVVTASLMEFDKLKEKLCR